jgi:hypothetical protein
VTITRWNEHVPADPLDVEHLEDRLTPVNYGTPWPDPGHLTLSFAPDGTPVGTQQSGLFGMLGAQAPTHAWQLAVLRAFQTWAVNADVNVGVVPDGGQPFDTGGAVQGDPRFGDVRIGAVKLGSDATAMAAPFDIDAGTSAGDVRLNTAYRFAVNAPPPTGPNSPLDLYTVMLHEAGHVFGLDDSTDPTSAMYANYTGPRAGPSAADVANLQGLYGARTGTDGNNSFATATPLLPLANSNLSLTLAAAGAVNALTDKDFYSVTTPLDLGGLDVTLHTTGLSLLAGKVTVYDSTGRVVGSAVRTDPLAADLTLHIAQVNPLSQYYVEVQSGTGDVFGIGGYLLQVKSAPLVNNLLGVVNNVATAATGTVTDLVAGDPLHLDGTFLTATLVPSLSQRADGRFTYAYRSSLNDGQDVDYYRVQAPAAPGSNVLQVMAWAVDGSRLTPAVRVYDAQHNPVPAQVLVNDGSTAAIQIVGTTPGATYFVEVLPSDPGGANNSGAYFLGVDFTPHAVRLGTMAAGTLTPSAPQSGAPLAVNQTAEFHFVLSAAAQTQTAVTMTITDAHGHVIFTLTAGAGEAVSKNVLLEQGTYFVQFTAVTPAGATPAPLSFQLQGLTLTDPNGPTPTDTTEQPGSSSPPDYQWYPPPDGSQTSGSDYTGGDPSNPGVQYYDPSSPSYATA